MSKPRINRFMLVKFETVVARLIMCLGLYSWYGKINQFIQIWCYKLTVNS